MKKEKFFESLNSHYACRVVKDCGQIANEIGDVRAATDEVARSKVSSN